MRCIGGRRSADQFEIAAQKFSAFLTTMTGDKLSKRKKKALAFRGKKVSKEEDEEANAVPVEDTPQERSWLGKDIIKSTTEKSKKRKRTDDEPAKNPSA